VSRGASLIGLVHGDVQAGEPDRLARGREPLGVAELGQDRDRGQLPNPELAQQRFAARLVARERTLPLIQWGQLNVERVDHFQRDGDLLARRDGQCEPGAALVRQQFAAPRAAVVIWDRLDALLRVRVRPPVIETSTILLLAC
jgi:hypothetical protein